MTCPQSLQEISYQDLDPSQPCSKDLVLITVFLYLDGYLEIELLRLRG